VTEIFFLFVRSVVLPGDSRGETLASSKPLECELPRECAGFMEVDGAWMVSTESGLFIGGPGGAGACRFLRCDFSGAAPFRLLVEVFCTCIDDVDD